MSNHDDRFAEIETTWIDADDNYEEDYKAASTPSEKKAITANRNAAYTAYIAAFHSALTKKSDEVEAIYKSLVDANKSIKEAREELEKIPKLLGKLATGTEKAAELVSKAKV